jgi:hypothetical protein
LAAFGFKIHAAIDHVLAVGKMDILQPDDALPAALRLREGETDFFVVTRRRFDLLHAINLLELALRLRRFGSLGAEAVGELL